MAQPLQAVLFHLMGRVYKPPKMSKAAEKAIRELEASLKSARQEIEHLRTLGKERDDEFTDLGEKYNELKRKDDAGLLELWYEAPLGEDADQVRRGEVQLGGVDARVLIKRKQPGTLVLSKPNGEACWRGNICSTDKLVLRYTAALADSD